ncbi:MAG: SDR family NAD(P)-dependent oxidoreductase, partial [Mycobacterium sp.]|nr:SDR family NAD(P)-dependent oxidoreductase [Mycobacterium sp.]
MTSRIRHSQSQGDVRTAVITGASRGLGFASAVELYRRGWRVLAAMRSAAAGLELLREATGARKGDPRLQGIALDLLDTDAVQSAADAILEAGGAPDALVHNAG